MVMFFAGTVFALAGIGCLYSSWQRNTLNQRWLIPVGWLLLIVATIVWVFASGAEFGIAYGLMFSSVLAWLVIFFNAEIRQNKHREKTATPIAAPGAKAVWRHVFLFAIAVPLSGAAALLFSVALTLVLPWKPVNEMVLAVFLMPVLWGLATYWACADEKVLRPALVLAACATASAILIYT